MQYIEKLIHKTKNNEQKYKDFNKLYHIKSPTFNLKPNQMPTYYKNNMFKIIKNKETKKDKIFIKILRNNNDYQWIKIQIKDSILI